MSASPTYSQARRAVLQACDAALDSRSLRIAILDEIARVVGFEAYAWLLTDPRTSVGTSPVADVPWLPDLPRQIKLKYQTPVNRWTRLKRDPVALLHQATGGNLAASLVWRELLADYDSGDVASMVFRDRFGCWAFLELWRSRAQGPFSQDEAALMADLARPITAALRRTQALTFAAEPARDDAVPGPVVLLLSADLKVHAQTPETRAYLRLLVPPAEGRAPVPATAYNVGAQVLAVEAQVDESPPQAGVHIAQSLWVTVRAARIEDERPPADRDIAVTMERSTPAERADMFGRVFGLTRRETELLDQIALGHDTREVAGAMFVSENTVQDHLKRGEFYTYEKYLAERIATRSYDPRGVILAVRTREWVGMAATSLNFAGGYAFSEMTGVLPSHRGRGISLAMKLLAIRFTRARGYRWLRTFHHPDNVSAVAMHRRWGFVDEVPELWSAKA